MKYFLAFIFVFSLFLFACESPVSLGARLSMAGPQVTITKPTPDRSVEETDPSVRTVFNVSGTVKDDLTITSMTVTLDYWNAEADSLTRMGREWKWESQWMARESEEDKWQPYTQKDYNPADADPRFPSSPPAWLVNKNIVSWNLPVNMNRMEQGEYFITVSAWNSAGRHDSQSSAKLKIKYNNFSPTVRIINPLLFYGTGSLAFPLPPSWDEYVFDPFNAPEETSLNLMHFTNSFNDLSYRLEYTISPPTAFSFELTNEHDLDDFAEEKTTYYQWQWEGEEFPPERGVFTDRPGDIGEEIDTYVKAGGRIELSDTVKDSLPRDTVTPMQLVTRVKDATGLEEYKSKGWFLYLPDSDKPYPYIDFAYRVHKDAVPPSDAAELATMLRGSVNYNNLVYDDDGVKELRWTVYKLKDDSLEVERIAGSSGITFEGNKKELWSFPAHKSFGTGRFKIVVTVQDIYGAWGDEFHGYFTIFSNATPTVVTPLDSPESLTTTFWGDENGNITIAGRAQIEDYDDCNGVNHGVMVNDITIAWIKPGLGVENNFRYLDANDPLWDGADGADFHGNRIWRPSLSFVASTAGNNGENDQEEWAFSQTLNYFSDLGIGIGPGKLAFNDQQFRIRVLSHGGANALPRSSVYAFTTRCDVAAPVLEITHIVIKHETVETEYDLASYGVLPVIAQGDEVRLKGTYSDDSIGQWTGLGPNRHNEYLTGFTVSWEGEENKFNFNDDIASFTLDNPDGGNWTTGWHTFADDHNKDPIIQLTAGLTDAAGRRGTANMVLIVETLEPVLVRISSDNSHGYYGDYKGEPGTRYIDIYLEFNKPVSFMYDGAPALANSTAPWLELNNDGRAFYLAPGPGDDPYQYKITFRYFYSAYDGVNPAPSPNTAEPGYSGSDSTAEPGNPEGRLNVTSVNFGSYFTEEHWKGTSDIPAEFKKDVNDKLTVCDMTDEYSLAMQKRIIIDKTQPEITAVTTTATANRYGLGSQINIDVKFNESVLVTGMTSVNTFLSLTGGNLSASAATPSSPVARAFYQNVKDSSTINFLYTVQGNQDTSVLDEILGVSQMTMTGAVITDVAGNTAILAFTPASFTGVIIDTVAPAAPSIGGNVANNASYYGDNGTTFIITGITSGNTVEYNLNYPTETGWTFYNGGAPVTGTQTGAIGLTINGVYQIAARQYDTAIPPNCSPASTVLGPVRIDKGGILQRITSSLPDGSYSYDAASADKKTVMVDLEFRIPVTLAAGTMSTGTITLNTTGGSTANATLTSAPANNKKWTFTYTIPSGAYTTPDCLDVSALNLDSLTINDQYGTRVNGTNGWLTLTGLSADRKLSNQKKIIILAGRPRVLNMATGNALATAPTGGIQFTGTQLNLTFDRDIYRGLTSESLVIRQIAGSGNDVYKIPAVLSETQWNDIFINRTDLNSYLSAAGLTAGTWQTLGTNLYEKGSNGAAPGTAANSLVSDTSVKYVLKYAIDPDSEAAISGVSTTMANIRAVFRQAETLSFIPNDQRVSINGKVLSINLSSTGSPLPVKGARYEWVFPNGFVRDILGTANGTGTINDNSPSGNDTNLTTATTAAGDRVLFYNTATDPPVIRINKNPAVTFTDATAYRQIKQPVTTTARINSRTPNASIQYWKRQTIDNVPAMLMVIDEFYPFFGYGDPGSPQSNLHNLWHDMAADWGGSISYTLNTPFSIGNGNYTDGGMIIHLRAQATATGVTETPITYGYESAYRSVFVYINQSYWSPSFGRANREEAPGTRLHQLADASLLTSTLDRVWIRGSNNLGGDSSIPDFPLSRDQTKSRKAQLLTPMWLNYDTTGTWTDDNGTHSFSAANITAATTLTESNIATLTNYSNDQDAWKKGRNQWYWVTWGINVLAYIDIFYGELPSDANTSYQVPTSNLRFLVGNIFEYKERYQVFPGRTTIFTPRSMFEVLNFDSSMGALGSIPEPVIGPAFNPPPPSDQN